MCGIAGAYIRDPKLEVDLDSMLSTMLESIDHRGGDATGYLALDSFGVAEWQRASCDAKDFNRNRRPVPVGTRTILAHTRYATQGLPAFIENNHPLRRGSFYVIHNGHVINDQELFKLSGRDRYGQVDSEAIAARISSLGSLDLADKAMGEIDGAAAIAAVDGEKPHQLVLAKGHSSPLFVLVTNKIVLWGSTESTVKTAYKKHVGRVPKKRKVEYVPTGTMIFFDNGKQTRKQFAAYEPPKYVWTPKEKVFSEIGENNRPDDSVRYLPKVGGWPKWDPISSKDEEDELLVCDSCGATVHYQDAEYEQEDGITWTLCRYCGIEDAISEDPAAVNAAILAADFDREKEESIR